MPRTGEDLYKRKDGCYEAWNLAEREETVFIYLFLLYDASLGIRRGKTKGA